MLKRLVKSSSSSQLLLPVSSMTAASSVPMPSAAAPRPVAIRLSVPVTVIWFLSGGMACLASLRFGPVDLVHQPAVGLAGCGELVISLFQCAAEVQDGLALGVELGLDRGVACGRAEAAGVECLLPEQFRQPLFQVADLPGEPAVLLVQVGVLGERGLVADRGGCRGR